jgi:hypothetical protein
MSGKKYVYNPGLTDAELEAQRRWEALGPGMDYNYSTPLKRTPDEEKRVKEMLANPTVEKSPPDLLAGKRRKTRKSKKRSKKTKRRRARK